MFTMCDESVQEAGAGPPQHRHRALETRHAPDPAVGYRGRRPAHRPRAGEVEAHRGTLLSIKRGELSWPEVDAWRVALHEDFSRALTETKLPERPDYEAANTFLIAARREAASSGKS